MKYFLDTEFHEYCKYPLESQDPGVNTIELISIGIVAEDGREFYEVSNEFDFIYAWSNFWLQENVIIPIYKEFKPDMKVINSFQIKNAIDVFGFSNVTIRQKLLEFIGEDKEPEFWAYYADYDWVVFCWLFGRMITLPKHFPMYCKDLKQLFDIFFQAKSMKMWQEEYCPKNKDQHNALGDAKWNKAFFEVMKDYYKLNRSISNIFSNL